MANPTVKRVAALLRVSTESVAQSESPEAQLMYVQEEIRRRREGAEVWLDSGCAYKDELTGAIVMNRPGIKQLLADANARRFDVLAMKSIQRLGRDTLGLLHLKRLLDDLGIELVALQDGYSSRRDPELIFLVHADRAQAGREDISRNVRTAMRQRANQGRWMSGNVAFGYRRKNRHELEPHPDTAPVVREIFRLRRMGWGANRIVGYLNDTGVPAPAWWEARDRMPALETLVATDERYQGRLDACRRLVDRRPAWTTKSLRLLLASTIYYGEAQYYRKFWKVRVGGRKTLETRHPDEWITVPCPALITREEWEEAQEVRRSKSRTKERDKPGHVYLLTGLLICGTCGGRMNGGGGVVGKHGFYSYYHCQARRDQRTCDQTSPRSDALEDALLKALSEALEHEPEIVVELDTPQEDVKARIQSLEVQLADLSDQRRYYRNEHRRNRVSDSELDAELARITAEEQPLRSSLAQLIARSQLPTVKTKTRERRLELAAQIARWQISAADMDRGQLRTMIQREVKRIVFRALDDFDVYLNTPQL